MSGNGSTSLKAPASASYDQAIGRALASVASHRSFSRGQEVCAQNQTASHWYRLVSGAARHCVIRADGRRQIVDLLLPGDYFGFAASSTYDYTVEASMSATLVAFYPRRRVEELADQNIELARELRRASFEALARQQKQLLILGRITALEKVGSFILEMAGRIPDDQIDRVVLPVSRDEIADYLAVSVETVSRALTELKTRGLITLSGTRTVRIVDRSALEENDREGINGVRR